MQIVPVVLLIIGLILGFGLGWFLASRSEAEWRRRFAERDGEARELDVRCRQTDTELATHPSVTITMTPMMELSATFIRQSIAKKKNVQYFVPDVVLNFIDAKHLYR